MRSMYKEDRSLYIDQPCVGIYKINSNDFHILDQILLNGSKEKTSVLIDSIYKYDL